MKPFLSKTKFMDALRCTRLCWFEYFRRDAFVDASDDMYEEGRQVGALARAMLPEGVLIERELKPHEHHKKSTQALELRKPLFEAGFVADRLYALADILIPTEDGNWDLYEVKSSTSVKQDHLYDMAFQKYVYESAGVPIRRCFVMYVNSRYVRNGPLDPSQLFLQADITEGAQDLKASVGHLVAQFLEVLEAREAPEVPIGPQCLSPRECPLKYLCWKHLPARDSVFSLFKGKELAFSLTAQGIHSLFDIPDESVLTSRQRAQIQCHRTNDPFVNKARLRRFLGELKYPLAFLDFETIGPAIPVFDATRPYEQIPFQFSLFIRDAEGASDRYYAFLNRAPGDPRPRMLVELIGLLEQCGAIVAYNAKFEISVLKSAAAAYPDYNEKVEKLSSRFVDLLEPFMGFYYYHPGQQGRNSLKFVLPALTGTSYQGLAIANGVEASSRYYRVTYGKEVSALEREKVYAALEEYCKQDTKGMIDVLDVLRSSARQ